MKIEKRYEKNIGTIGADGQAKLGKSHVAVVGAGGLGGTVLEIIVRYGVGKITVVDFDSFERTNLNRQLLATERTLGQNKAEAALARARDVNPEVEVIAKATRLTDENATDLIGGVDLVCDCLGNITDRFVLERAARELGVPMVHAAIAGWRGQLMTIMPDGPGLEAIYGKESKAPKAGDETKLGCPPSSVMAVAALQAHKAIEILTGEKTLQDAVLTIDLGTWRFEKLSTPSSG